MTHLNERQKKAIESVVNGMTRHEAGVLAGYSKKSAGQTVSNLLKTPMAVEYFKKIEAALPKMDASKVLNIIGRKEILTGIARQTGEESTKEAISAIDMLNKMDGAYVEKLEVTHSGGVMVIPMSESLTDWEKLAAPSQAKLMADAVTDI